MRQTARAQLDQLDLEILTHYQQNTQTPAHSIGKAVGLSAAAVQRRLKNMRESGVIAREAAQLDPAALGLTLTCIVNVQLVSDAASAIARFRKQVASLPEVQQCYYVTGSSDFVLIVVMGDMEDYETFTNGPLLTDANIRKFTTQVVLSRTKVGLDICLSGCVTKP
jgi:Lrp/AsnC family leucine-responsive transcriptional regulator